MKHTLTLITALLLAPPVVLAQTKTTPQFNTVADKTPAAVDQLDQALTLARRTLDFVQRSRPCPALASRLKQLEQRAAAGEADRAELCQSVRQLRRQIIFSHPLLDFDRLLVNKCPPPAYSHQSRQYLGRYSRPGPGLVVLDNWKDGPREMPLLAGHPDKDGRPLVRLDRESFQRIVDWLDLNAVCYGDYSWNKLEWREPSPDGERALREEIRRRFGPQLAEQPLAALVNVALPEESRILQAPLAAEAGGWGLWPERAWRSAAEPGYVRMRELVRGAIASLDHHDLAGTCGRPDRCLCDCCWVRLRNGQDMVPGDSRNR